MPAGPRPRPCVVALSAGLDRATRVGSWLVLPLALLLFALYVALALREAARSPSRSAVMPAIDIPANLSALRHSV